ncbi:MAG: tRNA uracil 4-sulfurtransferase ThiI [Anaerolineae bacterium]
MSIEKGLILCRYGEIGLKGQNFPRFVRQLRGNAARALRDAGIANEVTRFERRIYAEVDDTEAALEALSRVFGFISFSPAVRVPADIEAIKARSLEEAVASGLTRERSFRVQARRADKSFPLKSLEINREVGAHIVVATGARVDLSEAADYSLGVEIQHDHALLFARVVRGAGGLPVPLSGPVVALISVGLDSPVAAWMMMKRGCGVIPLHFAQSDEGEARFRALCDVLQRWSHGWKFKPIVIRHADVMGDTIDRLRGARGERWACLFCKRAMVRAAIAAASERGAHGVVLGDSLGQVASQTLENMRIISAGADLPIYRPLIGLDKVEIMAMARRIGTYDISAQHTSACPYLPEKPVTMGSFAKYQALVERMEQSES